VDASLGTSARPSTPPSGCMQAPPGSRAFLQLHRAQRPSTSSSLCGRGPSCNGCSCSPLRSRPRSGTGASTGLCLMPGWCGRMLCAGARPPLPPCQQACGRLPLLCNKGARLTHAQAVLGALHKGAAHNTACACVTCETLLLGDEEGTSRQVRLAGGPIFLAYIAVLFRGRPPLPISVMSPAPRRAAGRRAGGPSLHARGAAWRPRTVAAACLTSPGSPPCLTSPSCPPVGMRWRWPPHQRPRWLAMAYSGTLVREVACPSPVSCPSL